MLFILPEIRKVEEGEDTIFKGGTERAAEEGEANRKIQEAQAAQEAAEGEDAEGETAEGETGEGQGDGESEGTQEGGSGDNNG